MAITPDSTNTKETPDVVVLTSYKIDRGVGDPGEVVPAPIIIELSFAECKIMYEDDGITPKSTAQGTPAYRRSRQGAQWTIFLDLNNPAHQPRAIAAMIEACEIMANAVYTLDGINKTPTQLNVIAQQLVAAGLPDAALAQAAEEVEVARRNGATDMQINK